MNTLLPAFLAFFGLISAAAQSPHPTLPACKNKYVVIAHRGDHEELPENTLAAYASAIKLGVDYVEVDLRTTKDNFLVILHNETVDRMTNGKGKVKELGYTAIRAMAIAGNANNRSYMIPSFKEVLDLCRNNVNIYLDFKDADPGITYKMIRSAGMEKHVVVYANSLEQLEEWGKTAPGMPVITSVPDEIKDSANLAAFLDKYPIVGLDGSVHQYSPAILKFLKQRKIAVWLDVQNKEEGASLWEMAMGEKVEGMQTDHPAALIGYLKSHGIR
jgi:glycerophosphoryl diester phosphodiesterase